MRTGRAPHLLRPGDRDRTGLPTATFQGPSPLDDPGLAPVPGPGSPGVSMQPADIPAIGNPSLRPGGIRAPRPGFSLIPCTVTRDQLRRKGDRPPSSRHDTRGCQHRGNPKDPVGGK
jgi:hypothetical protein